jgi:hypothetical protein
MGARVGVERVLDLFFFAASAALSATADAGDVKGRVVRAEGAMAAVPKRRHYGED